MKPLPAANRLSADPTTVAIVDDSAVVRGLFARWLGEAGDMTVVGIHPNGPDLLRTIGSSTPNVVILDLLMPGMDGLQVLPMVRQLSPTSIVLVVSSASQTGSDVAMRLLMRGACHYLHKPSALQAMQAETFKFRLVEKIRSIRRLAV